MAFTTDLKNDEDEKGMTVLHSWHTNFTTPSLNELKIKPEKLFSIK